MWGGFRAFVPPGFQGPFIGSNKDFTCRSVSRRFPHPTSEVYGTPRALTLGMTNELTNELTNEAIAARLAQCEESFRRAQRGCCPDRYRAALAELERVERIARAVLLCPELENAGVDSKRH